MSPYDRDPATLDERYRALFEQSAEGLWCADLDEPIPTSLSVEDQVRLMFERGYLGDANVAMARMYGFDDPSLLIGARIEQLLPPEDPHNVEYLRAFVRSGYRLTDAESHEIDRDGAPKVFANNLVGTVHDGLLWRAWGTQRDITQRRLTAERLRRSQKAESLAVLAGGVAHDLNNLLAVMMGHAQLALKRVGPAHPAVHDLERVLGAAETAAELARHMLAYAGRGEVDAAPADLNELVRRTLTLIRVAVPSNVAVTTELDPALSPAEVDASQMQQVVMNLVLNAAEALGAQSGSVHLATSVREPTAAERADAEAMGVRLADGPHVVLAVTDDGPGMPADVLARVFDPFFTTKTCGRGLGLAAVQGIVLGHQGAVLVASALGGGARFEVLLPRARGAVPASRAVEPEPEPERVAGAGGTILVVDDDREVLETIHDLLTSAGFATLVATSAEGALEELRAHRGEIRAVLVARVMPGPSGRALRDALRAIEPRMPIVTCCGFADEVDLAEGPTEIDVSLLKPVRLAALLEAIERVSPSGAR
ncbi:MAG: response regulator [Deltaproteobacteria bacterium]|nr:response regulator [Deltaproteobacteria bacterium]